MFGGLETSLSGERMPTHSAGRGLGLGPPTYLQPRGLGASRAGELTPLFLPGTGVPRSQGLPSLAQRKLKPWAAAAESGSPYLFGSPAPRSWGPCGWSAFSPGKSAALFLAGACPTCESTEPGSAAPRQVPGRVRLISIARCLGQLACGAAGAGRGGTSEHGFGATPRTGARRGGRSAWPACPAHGTSLACAGSHADTYGLTHPFIAD